MCFYRDTQAALASNNLQNLVKQRGNPLAKVPAVTNLPKKTEVATAPAPHKKLHISKGLYTDLLHLSSGSTGTESNSSPTQKYKMEVESPKSNSTTTHESVNTPTTTVSHGASYFHEQKSQQLELLLKNIQNTKNETPAVASYKGTFDNVLAMMENNNKLLQSFQEQSQAMTSRISNCLDLLTTSSQSESKVEESPFEVLERISLKNKRQKCYNPSPSSKELLSFFTNGKKDFSYELVLNGDLTDPIFRERNIKVPVKLVRCSDNAVLNNHGNMLLQIALYTSEVPSNLIIRNKSGNKVLQGEDECDMKNGEAVFDKMQINEVTSKFINGNIAIVVVPKRPANFGTTMESLHQKNNIRIEDIKPLLISNVSVKSKKKKRHSAAKEDLEMEEAEA